MARSAAVLVRMPAGQASSSTRAGFASDFCIGKAEQNQWSEPDANAVVRAGHVVGSSGASPFFRAASAR